MLNLRSNQQINDLLGSAVVFASAISDLMAEQLEQVAGNRVTFAQLKVLKLLSLKGRLGVTDVAAFMGISPAAASKGIDRLVRSGMLERAEARRDRRALRVSLTKKATDMLDEYDGLTAERLDEIFGHMSERQLSSLAKSLDELSISIVNHEEAAEDACFRCGIHFREKCLLRPALHRTCYMDIRGTVPDVARSEQFDARVWKRPPP